MTKRNENRPGYKKTRVGWIPKEWECVPFGYIIRKSQYGLSISSSEDGNVLIIGMSNLQEGKIVLKDAQKVRVSDDEYEKFRIKKYDLIFNRTNSLDLVGKTALAIGDIECVFASYLVRFTLSRSRAYPFFVAYYFNQNDAVSRLKALATPGVSQCNINPTTLKKHFHIPLPPLPEQKKIAESLSAWDRAIEQVGKLIDAKLRLKKGLMQQLLTGRMRFPEFNHETHERHEKDKGELPVGWKACKLGACFKERKETNPDLPLLAITSDRGVIPRDEVERKDTSNADKSKYKRIAPGDIGYNTMRMWQGVSAVSTLEGIVSPAYTICTPRKGHSSSFFGYLFKYPPMIHLFHRFSQGLVSDTLNLKFRHLSQVKANVPSETEQIRIAAVLSACDREIELLKKKHGKLKEQKKGLMQKLLTGEVRHPKFLKDEPEGPNNET